MSLIDCRRRIEQQIALGASESWTTADYERLSEAILSKTGVRLSVTTLKRVWGKIRYDSSPTITTLNALAQYIGYANWQDFSQVSTDVPLPAPKTQAGPPAGRPRSSLLLTWGLPLGACLLGLLLLVYFTGAQRVSPDDYSFRSRPVTKGLPNSVIFEYDASRAPTDSVFIQQSWDAGRRQRVDRAGHRHTSIYYYPGYFRAKLVVGEQVVAEHDLLIRSNGWHVAILEDPVPVYVKAADVIGQGRLHVPVSLLQRHGIPLQPRPPVVRYRYVEEMRGLRSDNFVLETRLRNEYGEGAAACQHSRVLVHGKGEVFIIPLSAKGCVSDLYLTVAGHEVSGRQADLSAFGVEHGQWVDLRLEVTAGRAKVYLNGRLAYQTRIPTSPVDLVGISYDFSGTGSVDYCRLAQPDGGVVFSEGFESIK